MGAEHPAQGVGLVHDHVGEPAQEGRPALVAGEDAAVEHVRVGQHQVGAAADHRPVGRGGVAVVGGRPDPGERERADGAELVAGQGLGGGEVQGGAVAVAEQGVEHRELVAEALAGGGAGGHHDIAAGAGQGDRRRLVGPERGQAPGGQPRADHLGQVVRQVGQPRRPCRQALQVHELAAVVGVAGEVVHQHDRVVHAVMVSAIPTSPAASSQPTLRPERPRRVPRWGSVVQGAGRGAWLSTGPHRPPQAHGPRVSPACRPGGGRTASRRLAGGGPPRRSRRCRRRWARGRS